ncbi:MAG: GNAT family N-acetyltransferase [Actinomycetota bacterium]
MHLELRAAIEDDLPILYRNQADPGASAMAAFPSRDWDAFVAHEAKIGADDTMLSRTIVVDGEVAGGIGSWQAEDERDVGYWIGREFWGRGIATAALHAFLEIETTRPVYAHVAAHNVGSRRVLEKCGFTVLREQHVDDVDELVVVLA